MSKDKQQPINFSKAISDIEKFLYNTHNITQIKDFAIYDGEEIRLTKRINKYEKNYNNSIFMFDRVY